MANGVPFAPSYVMLHYRTDLFEAEGLTVTPEVTHGTSPDPRRPPVVGEGG